MKKYLFLLGLLSLTFSLSAQRYKSAPIGLVNRGNSVELLMPSSIIEVEIVVDVEEVISGPYARYSQKYLAARAPLTNQTTYKISNASIGLSSEEGTSNLNVDSAVKDKYFKLPIDQLSSNVLPADVAAQDAAKAIYTLRRQRRELVTGYAGEGYFGGGLQAALDRLDQMEQEYIALFMGTTKTYQVKKKFYIKPDKKTTQYVVCRFDEKSGILPDSNLSGTPVSLLISPMEVGALGFEASPKESNAIEFRVAAPSDCILYNNTDIVAKANLELFEFGRTVRVVPPRK